MNLYMNTNDSYMLKSRSTGKMRQNLKASYAAAAAKSLRKHNVAEPGSIKVLDKATVSAAAGCPVRAGGTATCRQLWG